MNLRKLMAGTLAATMVVGSSLTVLAEGATGTGTSFDHVDKDVLNVTLPTTADVADVFNYYVDPERVINSAGQLTTGSGAVDVTANTDGVYFAHKGSAAVPASVTFSINGKTEADTSVTVTAPMDATKTFTYDGSDWKDSDGNVESGISVTGETAQNGDTITVTAATPAGAATYESSSEAVNFVGQNSVDVDVSVAATVTATAGDKDIALVADDAALTAATDPALLMKLKVGSEEKAITSEGTSAKATLVGKSNNFVVSVGDNNKYTYGVRTDTDTENDGTPLDAWDSTTVQLVGKTNQKDIPEGVNAMTAPTINLTWTVEKHVTTPTTPTYTEATAHGNWSGGTLWLAKDASTGFSSSSLTVEVSDGGTDYTALASDKYSVNDANWVSTAWANITEALGGNPSGNVYVRITDGTTRYTFQNN